jgi:tRNA(adenine34) deaminase
LGGVLLHRQYIIRALDEARKGFDEGEVPVGAVVVQGDRVVASAHNMRESMPDPTAHAEVLALREAAHQLGRWRLDDCTLYVTLEPCSMCAAAVVEARIRRVVFGASDPRRGALGSYVNIPALLGSPLEIIGGVQEEACEELLNVFFKGHRS